VALQCHHVLFYYFYDYGSSGKEKSATGCVFYFVALAVLQEVNRTGRHFNVLENQHFIMTSCFSLF